MDKDVIHIFNGILLSHEKNEIMTSVATWMDLEIIIQVIPHDITYIWKLNYITNELTYETDSDIVNRLVVVQAVGWGGLDSEHRIRKYKISI